QKPAATAVTPSRFGMRTGLSACVVVPSPSSPHRLAPHAATVPSDNTANTCPSPATTEVTSSSPCTATGIGVGVSEVVPLPSSPSGFAPQHRTVPSARRAHSKFVQPEHPVLEGATPLPVTATASVMPGTGTGTADAAVVPFPSWPDSF